MNDAKAQTYINDHGEALSEAARRDQTHFHDLLRVLIKEVDRDARHRAYDSAMAMSNRILNGVEEP